jgi:hypothetical protein
VADGEGDAPVVMEAPHPDARKLRACPLHAVDFGACPLHAVDFGDAVRYGPHATDRVPGECLISVRRLELLSAGHVDCDRVLGDQQVRHETTFWRALAAGCQGPAAGQPLIRVSYW